MSETAVTEEDLSTEGGSQAADFGVPACSESSVTPDDSESKSWRPNPVLAFLGLLLVAAGVFLFFTEAWLFATWSSLSVDEILYHLRTSLEGTNSSMVSDYLLQYGVKELAAVAVAAIALFLARKRKVVYRALVACLIAAAVGSTACAVYDLDRQIGLFAYLEQSGSGEEADFIEDHYVNPSSVDVSFPEQKRNVIYLMLESMEVTYADENSGGAFKSNLIPELTEIARENEDFSGSASEADQINGAICLPGCTWTMGAMFALTSGLPLKLPLSGNQLETADSFYPGITALGDILAQEGYAQELLIGSDAAFGGRELYFTQHGGFAMNDYVHAQEQGLIPEGYHVFWGYEDARLFEIAKQRLTELSAQDEPFNLTMLTVDTHFEDGYVCELCEPCEDGADQYANVMSCSSRQVAEFVEWVQAQPFYENTTIVICGDHTTMDSDFCESVPEDYTRRVVTAVINGVAQSGGPDVAREYSTLDLFPTTLVAMGATIPGDQLGLGVNLYSNAPTMLELYGLEVCETELTKQSDFMDAFSEVAITEGDMLAVAETAVLEAKVALGTEPDWLAYERLDLEAFDAMDELGEVDAVLLKAPAGTVVFTLENCYSLNSEALLDAQLVVTDSRTGQVAELPMKLVQNRPNYFWHTCITDFSEEDLPYLSAVASLSIEGFDEYEVAFMNEPNSL